MKFRKTISFGTALALSMALMLSLVPAASAESAAVAENIAVYAGGSVTVSGGTVSGDVYLSGDFSLKSGTHSGKINLKDESQAVTASSDQPMSVSVDRSLAFPSDPLVPQPAPEAPAAAEKNIVFGWGDWPEKVIRKSGRYESISGINNINVDTSGGDVVLVTDRFTASQMIKINGSGDVILYVKDSVSLSNTTVRSTGGRLNLIVEGSLLKLSGSTRIQGNVYVPNGSIDLTGSALVTGLAAAGGNVRMSGSASAAGIVHAPAGDVSLTEGASATGAVIAETVQVSGGSSIHADAVAVEVNASVSEGLTYPVRSETPEPTEPPDATPVPTEPPADGPAAVPLPEDAAHGLKAEFYSYYEEGKTQFPQEKLMMTKQVDSIRFNWGWDAPDPLLPRSDRFSARFTGYLVPAVSGEYTFTTLSDDGVRVTLGGRVIIDRWQDMALTYTEGKPVSLEAGKAYPIEVEYYDNFEISTLHLFWTVDGSMEIVPPAAFFTVPVEDAVLDTSARGLLTQYFLGADTVLDPEAVPVRTEFGSVNLNAGPGAPNDELPADDFSVSYTGFLEAPLTGLLTLDFVADDGLSVVFDGETIVDEWHANSVDETYRVTIEVTAGQLYPIEIRYCEISEFAACQLLWSADKMERQLVPLQYLHPFD